MSDIKINSVVNNPSLAIKNQIYDHIITFITDSINVKDTGILYIAVGIISLLFLVFLIIKIRSIFASQFDTKKKKGVDSIDSIMNEFDDDSDSEN